MLRRPDLAAILLVGFRGLLRSVEMANLCFSHVLWTAGDTKAVILLPSSKSGTRFNVTEKVVVNDVQVLRAVRIAEYTNNTNYPKIYPHGERKLSEEFKWLGALAGLPLSRFT